MLKSAREIQQVSERAKLEAAEVARLRQKDEANRRRASKSLEKNHLEFARRAISAAKEGQGSISITDLELDSSTLESLGFVVQVLTRRGEYENWLKDQANSKRHELERSVEAILSACPSFRFISEPEMRFRNPLMSLLESLWPRAENSPEAHENLVLTAIYYTPEIDKDWLNANQKKLDDCLSDFANLKSLERKHREVAFGNRQIPEGVESCLFVSWDLAPACNGKSDAFDARLVRWFYENWDEVSDYLAEAIEGSAKKGLNSVDIKTSFNGEIWELYNTGDEDELQGNNPLILRSELSQMGYLSEVYEAALDDGGNVICLSKAADEDLRNPIVDPGALSEDEDRTIYVLRVRWDA